ncbi:MAG: trypsin-like peptidase domain-containing protein [Planctomycetes bacterium]|nr:trypsin-like peptidase domain-containing protein [Planctomycetota bacterium]
MKADNYNLKTAALADRDYQYYLFAPVYVVGCSLGLSPRPSSGIISAINFDSVEVSAPILPGNSGGPVYTADTHELIGIAVWVRLCGNQLVTTMAGIVPISEIYDFLDSATKTLRHQEKLSDFVPSWQINHRKELDYAESNVEFLAGCGQGGYQNRFGSHPEENRKIIATHRQLQALRGTVNSLAQLRIESVKNIATPLTCWKGLPIIRVSLKCNGAGEKHRSPPMSSRGALCLCGKRRM